MADKIDGLTLDLEQENKQKLKAVFPECFTEGMLDIDKLLSLCGNYIDNDFEKYKFEWKGKQESLRLAQKRSSGTLRPCKDESVNFDETENLYIEGDNLEVLKLLQTAYYGKVKMIYIDPPYNTGNDFVYEDDFKDPMARYKEITSQTTKSNPETMGRYHTNWLNMMYPRLRLASNLLRDDGVIFISIDDNEVHNLRKVCDEVFGEENFVAQIPWRKRTAKSDVPFGISQDYEWLLSYGKTNDFIACLEGGTRKYFESDDLPNRPWRIHDLTKQTSANERPNSFFTMKNPKTGKEYPANPNRTWAITKDTFEKYYSENRIVFPDDYDFLNISKPAFRYFKEDDIKKAGDKFGFIPVSTKLPENLGMTQDGTKEITELFENKVFGFPKPIALLKYFIKATTSTTLTESDIILDFFSGSATTAHAVMQLNKEDGGNRKFICVQLPEVTDEKSEAYKAGYKNICEIGKERIRRAGSKLVTSGELLVASDGEVKCGSKELPRDDCMAKGNGSSQANLFDCEETSERRSVCSFRSDAESCSINSIQHSGGAISQLDKGIHSLSEHSERVEIGTGNTASAQCESGLHTGSGHIASDESTGGSGENAQCTDKNTDNYKLTTSNYTLDIGFKVFKLDTSNIREWDATPIENNNVDLFTERLNDMVNSIKGDRTAMDVVYEVMLKMGVTLETPVSYIEINQKVVYVVGEMQLLICFAENITSEDIEVMASHNPKKIICAEQSFKDDSALSNAHYILRDKEIEMKLV